MSLRRPTSGGPTEEAQETVGVRIAEQVRDYLHSGVATNAVNMPSISAEQYGKLRPYLDLASRLGSFVEQIASGRPQQVNITYSGNFLKENTSLIRNAALAGIMNRFLSQKANLVNAAQVAAERGLGISENHRSRTEGAGSLSLVLETEQGQRTVQGAVFADHSPRLISVDGILCRSLARRSHGFSQEPRRARRDRPPSGRSWETTRSTSPTFRWAAAKTSMPRASLLKPWQSSVSTTPPRKTYSTSY